MGDVRIIRLARIRTVAAGICIAIGLLAAAMLSLFDAKHDPAATDAFSSEGKEIPALETFAGIPPVAYLVERIGGPRVGVRVLVQPGQDPHIFEPTPRQVVALAKARLFFKVGMPFEDQLVERIAARKTCITVVDTTLGIVKRMSDCDSDCDHDHENHPGAERPGEESEPTDPHVWLAPRLLVQMAANVADALCKADPANNRQYRANQAALADELSSLDARFAQELSPYRGRTFYVFHPAFGYFADAYGLKQESVEIEGKSPTPRQLYRLIDRARREQVKTIFLQPQFDRHTAAAIAQAIDGSVMPMDSLARDVAANLEDVAAKIVASNREAAP